VAETLTQHECMARSHALGLLHVTMAGAFMLPTKRVDVVHPHQAPADQMAFIWSSKRMASLKHPVQLATHNDA
jgi:Flp pilus assembly protein CpaB